MFPRFLTPFQTRGLTNLGTCLDLKRISSVVLIQQIPHIDCVRRCWKLLRTIHTSEYWVVPGIKVIRKPRAAETLKTPK